MVLGVTGLHAKNIDSWLVLIHAIAAVTGAAACLTVVSTNWLILQWTLVVMTFHKNDL